MENNITPLECVYRCVCVCSHVCVGAHEHVCVHGYAVHIDLRGSYRGRQDPHLNLGAREFPASTFQIAAVPAWSSLCCSERFPHKSAFLREPPGRMKKTAFPPPYRDRIHSHKICILKPRSQWFLVQSRGYLSSYVVPEHFPAFGLACLCVYTYMFMCMRYVCMCVHICGGQRSTLGVVHLLCRGRSLSGA